jgi:hypothetical protein
MAGISAYLEKAMLDFSLNVAAVSRPVAWAMGLSLGVPSSISGSEIATGSGMTRQTLLMAAAASPAGSASNTNALTFGPIASPATISGLQVWDTAAAAGGNMLWYGTLTTARALNAGDSLVFSPGSLIITLA